LTKKELSFYGIESDMLCLLYQEPDSISHTPLNCHWSKQFFSEVIKWSDKENGTFFSPSPLEILFGLESQTYPQGTNKFRASNNFPAGAGQIVQSNLFLLGHIPFSARQTSITSYRYKSAPRPFT